MIQVAVFCLITGFIAWLTYRKCRQAGGRGSDSREFFLAGGGLTWFYVAGSLTLTNINTDTLVGWNGNQTMLILWWELAGIPGMILLAKVFLPIYYRYNCTTVTELLERRYQNPHLRATVASLFLIGNIAIFLPIMLYTSSLFLTAVFGLEIPLMVLACVMAIAGAAYAILGGLRAVAVSDTYSGVLLFSMAILVSVLALSAVDWDLSTVPAERLSMIGDSDSVLPWHALLTGMIFTQLYYWSTNQTITQRALAATSLREAQKGCYAAAVIRATLVPLIVVVPGLCAYVLWGEVGDASYGRIVEAVLPKWLSGAFAAAMVAATMTSFNSALNSSVALYVCDIHQRYVNPDVEIRRMNWMISIGFSLFAILLVPLYNGADSIIQLIQQLIGLFSMPILAAFITGLMFKGVDSRAVIASLVFGAVLYGFFTFVWTPLHFLHLMFITLWACVAFALLVNRVVLGGRAKLIRFGSA
ncbi:MAG: SLC5 family protein [Puniceicoccaceae bacterium]